jgi:hypothetical protein
MQPLIPTMQAKRKNKRDFLKIKHRVLNDGERQWSVEEQESNIRRLLQMPQQQKIVKDHSVRMVICMFIRGAYMAAEGTFHALADNAYQGWYLVRQSLLYRFFTPYVCFPIWKKGNEDIHRLRSAMPYYIDLVHSQANIAGLSLIISPKEGDWLLNQMYLGLSDARFGWKSDDFYGAYLVRLYRMLKGDEESIQPPNPRKNWVHPYDNIFANWNNADGLAAAIYDMCEYHMHANNRDWDNHDAEFGDLFAGLNPIEIHVLEYVRHQLGLPTPRVEHELLQPPFYPIPDFVKNITTEQIIAEDPLLRDVVQFLNDWVEYPLK